MEIVQGERVNYVAVTRLNNQAVFNQIQQLIDSNYSKSDVQIIDISDKTIDELVSIAASHNITSIVFNEEDLRNTELVKKFQAILKNIRTQDQLEDIRLLPIADIKDTEGDKKVTKEHEQATTQKVRELYTGLTSEDKNYVFASTQNFSDNENIQPYLAVMLKAYLDDLILKQKEIGTDIRRETFLKTYLEAIEQKSPYTRGHLERVATFTEAMAKELKEMDESEGKESPWNDATIEVAKYTAVLHDIGKLAIESEILNSMKKFSWNSKEKNHLDSHSEAGPAFMLASLVISSYEEKEIILSEKQQEQIKNTVIHGITEHHEKVDMSNKDKFQYSNDVLPENLFAQLIAVPDSADAMLSNRGYNDPKNIVDCMRDILSNGNPNGKGIQQFEPRMAKAYIRILAKQAAQMGLDCAEMIKAAKGTCYDTRIKNYSENLDDNLIEYIQDISVNRNALPNKSCDLCFQLNEFGQVIFDNAKQYPFKTNKTKEELENMRKKDLSEDLIFEYYDKEYTKKFPNTEKKAWQVSETIKELMLEEGRSIDARVEDRIRDKKLFGKRIMNAGYKGIDKGQRLLVEATKDTITYGEIVTASKNIKTDMEIENNPQIENPNKEDRGEK